MIKKYAIRSVACGNLWQVWFWTDYQCYKLGLPYARGPIAFGLTIAEAWANTRKEVARYEW